MIMKKKEIDYLTIAKEEVETYYNLHKEEILIKRKEQYKTNRKYYITYYHQHKTDIDLDVDVEKHDELFAKYASWFESIKAKIMQGFKTSTLPKEEFERFWEMIRLKTNIAYKKQIAKQH